MRYSLTSVHVIVKMGGRLKKMGGVAEGVKKGGQENRWRLKGATYT